MSIPSSQSSLPYLSRTRQRFATSITLSTPSSPKEVSPFSKMFDSPKLLSLPKVNRASMFNKNPSTLLSPLLSPSGSEAVVKPRSLFGTTLQDIANPDEVDTQKEPQVNRTVKFDLTSTEKIKTIIDERKEESNECLRVIRKNLREIGEIRRYLLKEQRMANLEEKEKTKRFVEEAFAALNMQVKELKKTYDDSAMSIEPIEEDQDMIDFYYMLLQEISEFPVAFISKLKILTISICNNVDLCSSSYAQILRQKISNGLFILNQLQTRETVRDQWYRVVLYHLAKSDHKFLPKWKGLCGLAPLKKGEMDELIQTLKCIMRPEKSSKVGMFQADDKIKFLRDELYKFEPMILDEDWWTLKRRDQMY